MNTNVSVPTVTLQTAILLQIKEFATSGKTFSAHNITESLREKCNTGKMEIPEIEDLSGNDSYRYNVDHKNVRNLFNEMRDNGVFDADYQITKSYNGMFFVYTATSTTPVQPSNSPVPSGMIVSQTPMPAAQHFQLATAEIKRRVEQYLDNCKTRNFRPSIKHVQSAIKRGNHSTGISSSDLIDMIDLGYSVEDDINISYCQVNL
jgi:predicted metal-dependent hydrolase